MAIQRISIAGTGGGPPAAFPTAGAPATAGGGQPPGGLTVFPPPAAPPAVPTFGSLGQPIPVTIVATKPIPVTTVGAGSGGGGGGGGGPKGKTKAEKDREKAEKEREQRRTRFRGRAAAVVQGGAVSVAGAAQNQSLPAFHAAIEGATRGLDHLGLTGRSLSTGLGIFGDAVKATAGVVEAFASRGRELSGLSPELAAASARADLTRLQADLREAQDLGPQMAQLIESQAKAEATMREIWMPIKGFLLDALNAIMNGLLEAAVGILTGVNDILSEIGLKSDKIAKIVGRIEDILSGGGAAAIDPLEGWLKATEKWVAPAPAGEKPPAVALPAALGIPFIPGILGG